MFKFLKNGKGEILNLMFLDPGKKYYLSEIAKLLGKEPSAYQRNIEVFIRDGVFCEERVGNMRFFWLNKNYQLYGDLKSIISKTLGIEARLRFILEKIDSVETAFIFGSFANDKFNSNSDIDLFIIGNEDHNTLIENITKLETEINCEVNYHVYSREEVVKKIGSKDNFINNIFGRKIILLKGDVNEFRKSH